MSDHDQRQDAMDISDFVYAATGSRVRRLTMPDGEHWFPAVDVCRVLGHTTPRKALLDHVPEPHRDLLEAVTGRHGLGVPAGRRWRRDLQMVDLTGLLLLVTGSPKPAALPFREWMVRMVVAVQRRGSYALERAEVQPAAGAAAAYAVPPEMAEAIVALERPALRGDEEFTGVPGEGGWARWEAVGVLRDIAERQRRTFTAMHQLSGMMAERLPPPPAVAADGERGGLTAEQVLAEWRARLTLTEDAWSVAVLLAPALVEQREVRLSVAAIATRTGLTTDRVDDSLRFLLDGRCIRQVGTVRDTPVYALHRA